MFVFIINTICVPDFLIKNSVFILKLFVMAKKTDKDKLFERMGLVNPDKKVLNENVNQQKPPMAWKRGDNVTIGYDDYKISGFGDEHNPENWIVDVYDDELQMRVIAKQLSNGEWEVLAQEEQDEFDLDEKTIPKPRVPTTPREMGGPTTQMIEDDTFLESVRQKIGEYANENYPWGAKDDPAAPWNEPEFPEDEDEGPDPDERHDTDHGEMDEDDKWIQKAVDPAHKGYCKPMTKDTCTPKRKALAKRFKAGIEDEGVSETNAFLENVRQKISEYDEGGEDRYNGKLDQIKAEISQVKSKLGTNRSPYVFEKNGLLYLSGEDGEYFADYYGELSGDGDATIDPRLEAIAEKYGMYWDWEDAGSAVLVPEMDENVEPGLDAGVKFRAEVTGKGENRWSGNAMEYNTEEEAKEWLNNLANRWFGYDMSRVVPVTVPTGQQLDMANDIIYQNFRG
jgi:hypothetical protein